MLKCSVNMFNKGGPDNLFVISGFGNILVRKCRSTKFFNNTYRIAEYVMTQMHIILFYFKI